MVRTRTKRTIATSIGSDSGRRLRQVRRRITKDEVKRRSGYLLLGIFAAYLIDPIHNYIEGLGISPVFVAVVGLLLTFYYFEF